MPILMTHDGKTWKLVPKVGDGFTCFEWVEEDPKPAREQAMESGDE